MFSKPTFEIIVNIITVYNNYLFNIKKNLYYYEYQIKEEKNESYDSSIEYNSFFDNEDENL